MRERERRNKHKHERYHKSEEEMMPSRRHTRKSNKVPEMRHRPRIDPDGKEGKGAYSSSSGEAYESRNASFRSPQSMQTHTSSSRSDGQSLSSSSAGWERDSRLDEEDTRDDSHHHDRRRAQRDTGGGNSGRREAASINTEYDNVIVSKLQTKLEAKRQTKKKEYSRNHKAARNSKLSATSKQISTKLKSNPSEDMSMASSIDDSCTNSSGILDLDMDLDNVRSNTPTLLKYRSQKPQKLTKKSAKNFRAIDDDDSGIVTGAGNKSMQDASELSMSISSSHNMNSTIASDSIAAARRTSQSKYSKMSQYRQYRTKAMAGDDSIPEEHCRETSAAEENNNNKVVSRVSQVNFMTQQGEVHSPTDMIVEKVVCSPGFDDLHSLFSGATSVVSTDYHAPIQPLRWTEQETDNLLMQLEFFGDNINKDFHRFPKRSVTKVVNSIQAVVDKEDLRRDDPIFQNLNKALHSIRMVDLDKLLRLLQENHKVGDMMQDKRVIMLCGPTGCGKTTTLHFLAGTTLEEVDEQGFFHLKPVQFKDQQLKDFDTSCCRKHVTKTMQATTVHVRKKQESKDGGEETIVVCDTPGLGHVDCVEEEISNGLGMINELQRAKSIHPVLLLSRESLGSRFGNLIEIIHAIREQFVLESKVDLVALNYLFTKYEGKHRTRICKQISVLEKVPPNIREEDRVIYKAFVKDIVKKTTPRANLALPMEENAEKCVQDVWDTAADRDGKDLIVPFATKSSTQKLKSQLQLTVYDFSNLLAKGDYALALHRLHQLKELAQILPDAEDCADKAHQMGVRHVILVTDLIKELIDEEDFVSALYQTNELSKLEAKIPEAQHPIERTMKRLRKRLKHVVEDGLVSESLQMLESLRGVASQLPQAGEFVQQGFASITKRLLRAMEAQDVTAATDTLEELSKVAHKIPEATACAYQGLKALNAYVHKYADKKEYDELLQLMQRLCTIAPVFPDAKECIQVGFDLLRNRCIESFDGKRYSQFISQMRPLAMITPLLPPQHKFVNGGGSLLQDSVLERIERRNYQTAVDILLGLHSVQETYPEAEECIRTGFEILLLKAISSINKDRYEHSIDEMIKLGPLVPCLPPTRAPMKHGIKPLVKNVETALASLDFRQSLALVEQLHAASYVFPEVQDAVEMSVENLLQRSTAMVTKTSYTEGFQQLHQLGKIVRKTSIPSHVIQVGIADLQDGINETLENLDFDSCIDFLHRLDKLTDISPQINKFVSNGFEMLMRKAGQSMNVHDYSDALLQLEALGEVKHKFTLTEDSIQRGIADFSVTLNRFLQYTEFPKAVDVLQHLFRVSRAFPEAMQCVRLGYELLLEKAVDIYENQRFSQGLSEIKQLGQLCHQFKLPAECNRGNLKYLATAIPGSMQESDFPDALGILKELIQLVRLIPEALESVYVGYDALLERSFSELTTGNSKKLVHQMKQVAQVVEAVPKLAGRRSQSLIHLEERALETLRELDFTTCKDLLEDFNELVPVYPEVESILIAGYKLLQEKAAKAFEMNGGRKGIHQLHDLGQLGQFLKIDEHSGIDSRGSDMINQRILEAVKENDFETGRDILEGVKNLELFYPHAKKTIPLGYRELQEKVARAFDQQGYKRGINLLQQLLQFGMLLQIDATSVCSSGSELINAKLLEALKDLDFESTKDLLEDMHDLVQLHPEAESLVVAAYKHLQGQTALTFQVSGCRKGLHELQQLGKLKQHLDLSESAGVDGRGSDVINLKALEAMASLEFGAAVDFIEKTKKLLTQYPEGKEIVEVGFAELLERTAVAFQEDGHNEGLNQLQQLGQLRQLLADEKLVHDTRGNEMLKQKILEASKNVKFETAVELTGRVNKIVHLYPEAEEIVLAGYKQLLSRTAMAFEVNGYRQGVGRLQQVGQLKQLLEMDERDLDDSGSRGNDLLKFKILEKMKSIKFEEAVELVELVCEIAHIYPEAIDFIQAGFGELLEKVAATFEESGYEQGIKQLQELGQLKQQLEIDENAVKESRRRLLTHLVRAAQRSVEKLTFSNGIKFVRNLNDVAKAYPEVKDGVEAGFESLVYRVVLTFEDNKCSKGADQLEKLAELQQYLGLDDRALRGLENIVAAAQKTFEASELQEIIDLLVKLSNVADKFADARECMNVGVQVIWQQFEDTVSDKRYEDASNLLGEIGTFTKSSPLADRYFRKGMKRLKKIADSTFDGEDFMIGVDLTKRLTKMDRGLGEVDEAMLKGSDVMRDQMEKRIRQRDYSRAANLIHKLVSEMSKSTPQSGVYARAGLKLIEQQMEGSMAANNYSDIIEVLTHFATLEAVLPEASKCLDHGTQLLKQLLEKQVERKDFKEALSTIEKLHDSAPGMQRAHDCVQYGMGLMGKAIEKPLVPEKHKAMADIIHRLSQSSLPRASDCARRGLKGFWKTTKHSIEEHFYADAINLVRQMRRLAPSLPEAGDCVQLAFVALRVRLVKAIDKDKYEMAMTLLQQLSELAEELPEAFECAQFGFEALQERLEKSIDEEKYPKIMDQMRFLVRVTDDLPEVTELFAIGFSALSGALGHKIDMSEFKEAVELMEQLAELAKEEGRPEALDCTRQGLFKIWGKFEDQISEENYPKAVSILFHLGALSSVLPEAEDGVQLGFEVLEERFERFIDQKDFDAAISLLRDLSKLAYELPEGGSSIQNGFELLRERLVKIIEQQDFSTARKLITMLEQELPSSESKDDAFFREITTQLSASQRQTRSAVLSLQTLTGEDESILASQSTAEDASKQSILTGPEVAFEGGEEKIDDLRSRLISSLNDHEYAACIDAMLALSKIEHIFPAAGDTVDFGCNQIKDHLEMSIEKHNCTAILELMRILAKKTHRLPALSECSRFGLQNLQLALRRKVDQQQYKSAIEIMDLLHKLSKQLADTVEFLQSAVDASIQHMVVMREEVATSFEELGDVTDNILFAKILETTCESIAGITATEDLRMFCSKLESKMSETANPLKKITCAVRLSTSEVFFEEQIRKLSKSVARRLPKLLIDQAFIEVLSGKEDDILSVFERLLTLRWELRNSPGAGAVDTAVKETFDKFYVFIDGVISLAQSEFSPRMNLKSFERQVVILTTLINGLVESKDSLHSDERKRILDFEHRRARLLLRFEIEVADSLEVLSNYSFPRFSKFERDRMSSFIGTMRISQVQKNRDVLLACVNSMELSNMVSSSVDVSSAERTLSSFDKALEKFLDWVISQLEEEKELIDELPKNKAGLPATKEQVAALYRDVPKVMEELRTISEWPTESYSMDSAYYLDRVKVLDGKVKELSNKVNGVNGIASFLSSLSSTLNVAAATESFSCLTGGKLPET